MAPGDRSGTQIYVVVENISQQMVRTYATLRGFESAKNPHSCLGPPGMIGRGLRPGQRTGTSSWQGASQSDPPPAVWIDFVELEDGTTWGEDLCQVGDRLDGQRRGFRSQRDQLLGVFREKGADGLIAFIKENFEIARKAAERGEQPMFPLRPPPGHSRRWEEGYSEGAGRIIGQVIEAERVYGPSEIEHVLLRPIEPSEKESP